MSGSTKLITLVSILATLALGPLIWFVATVIAPAWLPTPESAPLQLIPVRAQPSLPPAPVAGVESAESPRVHRETPDPVARPWRYRSDGSLEFPLEK